MEKLKIGGTEICFHGASKPAFPFNGRPMMFVDDKENDNVAYVEFENDAEIDAVISALEKIKTHEKENAEK